MNQKAPLDLHQQLQQVPQQQHQLFQPDYKITAPQPTFDFQPDPLHQYVSQQQQQLSAAQNEANNAFVNNFGLSRKDDSFMGFNFELNPRATIAPSGLTSQSMGSLPPASYAGFEPAQAVPTSNSNYLNVGLGVPSTQLQQVPAKKRRISTQIEPSNGYDAQSYLASQRRASLQSIHRAGAPAYPSM